MAGAEEHVGPVFAALADPTRRRLLELLGEQPGVSATALAALLPVSRQAVVQHLAVLEGAGLVTSRRFSREVRFSVQPRRLELTASWLSGRAFQWEHSLQALKRVAEAGSEDRPDDSSVDTERGSRDPGGLGG
jgi:DNA-binding transcriptional ArsR family regulator